jgi:hypothetical protein
VATPDLGSRSGRPRLRASLVPRVTLRAAECGRDVRSATNRLSTPTRRVAPHGVLLFLPTARRGLGHGRPVSAPPAGHGNAAGGGGGDGWRDAQAGVPSAEWPQAQLAFKDSMVHGILQFTPSIAFRYVLHRCESRDIRCRESSKRFTDGRRIPTAMMRPRQGRARTG